MKRAKFSLTHYRLFDCNMGQLVPVSWFEALPGDTIQMATSALIRCAPLVTPVMHPVHVRFHCFFIPNRIVWGPSPAQPATGGWENFITGGANGLDTTAHPTVSITGNAAVGSLADYLGVPTAGLSGANNFSALPFRAYDLVWNEFFRDQDLQTALTVSTGDGADTTTSVALQNIAWEKDYLTSARPWEQKGPSISVPVGGQAPVTGIAIDRTASLLATSPSSTDSAGNTVSYAHYQSGGAGGAWYLQTQGGTAPATPNIFANLSAASGVDINVVRHAFAMQRWQEARARYGSRYVEYLRYLGVRSSDARLQRPELLGSSRQTIQFSEVLQTAPTTSGTGGGTGGIGQFGGHGIAAHRGNRYRRFFEEHGIVMCFLSVRPRTMYSQAVHRKWLRGQAIAGMVGTKEDYWQRELQYIGQQQLNGLEADATVGSSTTFGYQDRFDEYRRIESSTAGNFRTSTLDPWNFSREFGSAPALNSTFVSCVPATRCFANTAGSQLYVMAHMSIQARRLLAREGKSMTF